MNATISGEYEYVIRGTRGTVQFRGFSTQKGGYGQGGGMPPTGYLDSTEMQIDQDGTFEIAVSCEKRQGSGHGGIALPRGHCHRSGEPITSSHRRPSLREEQAP